MPYSSLRVKQVAVRAVFVTCLHAGFTIGVYFQPGDGGYMFFRKLRWLSTKDSSLHNHSYENLKPDARGRDLCAHNGNDKIYLTTPIK